VRPQAQLCRTEDAAGDLGAKRGAPTPQRGGRDGECVDRAAFLLPAKRAAHRWERDHSTTLSLMARRRHNRRAATNSIQSNRPHPRAARLLGLINTARSIAERAAADSPGKHGFRRRLPSFRYRSGIGESSGSAGAHR